MLDNATIPPPKTPSGTSGQPAWNYIQNAIFLTNSLKERSAQGEPKHTAMWDTLTDSGAHLGWFEQVLRMDSEGPWVDKKPISSVTSSAGLAMQMKI